MDTNGDGSVAVGEKTPLENNNGFQLNTIQPASGNHTGLPDGSETPGIDKPWNFFSNTGLHETRAPITIASDDGAGNVTLSMGLNTDGWTVKWGDVDIIPMGGDAGQGDTGIASITCGSTCDAGDTFTLNFSTHVPIGDPSGFGGVQYGLFMTGSILSPGSIQSSGALTATSCGGDGICTSEEVLTLTGGVADSGWIIVGNYFDFTVGTGVGGAENTVLPMTPAKIPPAAGYRKFNGTSWVDFDISGGDTYSTAASVAGICPPPGDAAYSPVNELTVGDDCIQLRLTDGGLNDADGIADGVITDPGGPSTLQAASEVPVAPGTDGCSLTQKKSVGLIERSDWLLVAAFIIWLGLLRKFRLLARK